MLKKSMVLLTSGALAVSILFPFGGTNYTKASELENSTSQTTKSLAPTLTVIEGGFSNDLLPTDIKSLEENEVGTYGVKKWITTTALKAASKALRSGGSIIDKVASQLTSSEAKIFTEHADTIADALDYLVKRGDVVEDAVMDTVASFLMDAGVKSSTARTIANIFTFFAL